MGVSHARSNDRSESAEQSLDRPELDKRRLLGACAPYVAIWEGQAASGTPHLVNRIPDLRHVPFHDCLHLLVLHTLASGIIRALNSNTIHDIISMFGDS